MFGIVLLFPASGNLTIETDAVTGSPLSDTVMSVFADCTSTTSIATLYVSVWKFSTTGWSVPVSASLQLF
ncbi:hypothetical protein [Chryseobacterium indoltheticum]|uniref:hypothetical protein n=1 Tax=Chryseobacterium indoltheticum TaxID=254 RepID=UPI003F49664A